MARILVYYAHPGARFSKANTQMAAVAQQQRDITFVDLYARYPRQNIDVDAEQRLLLDHDVIVFQFPMFWYSTPSLIKEWLDLVLEYGFAYGTSGTKLAGKTMLLAISTAGPEHAYSESGYQTYPLRTFLTPLEQTARLCHMRFAPPFVLHGAQQADPSEITAHAQAYGRLLSALRDETLDLAAIAAAGPILTHQSPLIPGRS